jgi:hypothetical protein
MSRETYAGMPYDKCSVDYVVDSLCNYDPEKPVVVWFNGKRYYIEEVDNFGHLPELIIGKEVK